MGQAQWGGIKKAVTKVLPKKVYYEDCSRKNSCLAANAACKAKLDSLRAAVAALDKEVAATKKVADAHSATAAQKAKYADLKQKDADAAEAPSMRRNPPSLPVPRTLPTRRSTRTGSRVISPLRSRRMPKRWPMPVVSMPRR